MSRNGTSRIRKRTGVGAIIVALSLVAACDNKKDESAETTAPTSAAPTTDDSTPTETSPTSDGPSTSDVTSSTPVVTDPARVPVRGGTLLMSGEAQVFGAWLPATMQCDSYCQQRARSFFDPLAAIGEDGKVHGVLAESIEPNADFTEWTITVRPGITFTDGVPLNAEAVIANLQAAGLGLIVSGATIDVAKVPDPTGATNEDGTPVMLLKIVQNDEMSLTIYTGKGGDPEQPVSWRDFDYLLATQWGLMASPLWVADVFAGTGDPTMPIGTGPFVVESYSPDGLFVNRNPDYWQTDANGEQLPYLDRIEFRVIEDAEIAADGLRSGELDAFATSVAMVINDFREDADEFPMAEQNEFNETNYLMIDLDKVGPLQDKRVRCALSMAIDRQELIEATQGGLATPANGLFSPGQEGYLEDNGFSVGQDITTAQGLIEDYETETGEDVTVNLGYTVSQINNQVADLLGSYWDEIGVDIERQEVPQDSFITDALLGAETFHVFLWNNHAGLKVDNQYFWWHSSTAAPDGALALNAQRMRDTVVDEQLDIARTAADPAASQAAAEAVNRRMAEECYSIPLWWTLWGIPHSQRLQGLGETLLPDGVVARDGAGFPGQFWLQSIWIDDAA